jgi:GNAT superfamily N-acetyltransferase
MTSDQTERLRIDSLTPCSLPAVEQALARGRPERHGERLELQRRGAAEYLIAWQGDEPVGHVLLHWGAQPHPSLALPPDRPYLEDVYVSPLARRRGVARALVERAVQLALRRGQSVLGLLVGVDNEPAQRLYAGLGFAPTGECAVCIGGSLHNAHGQAAAWQAECTYWQLSLRPESDMPRVN